MRHPKIHCLSADQTRKFLATTRVDSVPVPTALEDQLALILEKANDFVPSEAGSILLDDPAGERSPEAVLTFIVAFGSRAEDLVGKKIEVRQGIAGLVYRTGRSYQTGAASQDDNFFAEIDAAIDHSTECLIAIPIRLGDNVCGVLELLRPAPFSSQDLRLLEIFAGYISSSVHNALVARRASELARRDSLTGLFNDLHLHEALDQVLSRAQLQDLSLVFIDLDYFKQVNDVHGHLAGSQVLHEFGALLRDRIDTASAFAARYGGDEFVIALVDQGIERAREVADDVRSLLRTTSFCAQPGRIQQEPLHLSGLTASCGIAALQEHVLRLPDAEQATGPQDIKLRLLRLADAAMYRAKEGGRDRTEQPPATQPPPSATTAPRAGIDPT